MDRAANGPRAPEHLRWDVGEVENHNCSLATASATASEVVLNFGERRARGEGAVGPALLSRIAMSPLTAKNFVATLRRLIEDNEGGAR